MMDLFPASKEIKEAASDFRELVRNVNMVVLEIHRFIVRLQRSCGEDERRGMKKFTLLLLLLPLTVAAQTHPCDQTPPTSATLTAGTLTVGWCHDDKDANGNSTSITSWVLYANTARIGLTNVTNSAPSATGFIYHTASTVFNQGNYNVTVAAINSVGEGPQSAPFALAVSGPVAEPVLPRAPTKVRIPA